MRKKVRTQLVMPHSRVSNLSASRIALGYTVIAILWIAFSNAVVVYLKLPPAVQTIKGTVFVLVTATLLYFTIRRLVHGLRRRTPLCCHVGEHRRRSHRDRPPGLGYLPERGSRRR